jgi:glycosyltransferase involved in cell wall biosynthesis
MPGGPPDMQQNPEIPAPPAGRTGWPWTQKRASDEEHAGTEIDWPRITIVTPSFNQGRYLEETLRSVLLQDYPNLEYIVMDGGSMDDSLRILEKYGPLLSYWRSAKDAGQADAIASGFDRATGEILGWLNSDDILLPGALRHVGRLFSKHSTTGVVYGNRLVVDEKTAVTGKHIWPHLLTRYHWALGQPLAQECCFWRKSLYLQVGGIDRSKFFIMDYDLLYRMWTQTAFRKTRAYLGAIRVHGETKNARHAEIWRDELAKAKQSFALAEPGYFWLRFLNRLDRFQMLGERLVDWACRNEVPDLR